MAETTPDYVGLSHRLGALAYHIQQTGTADGQDAQTCLEVAEALRELLAERDALAAALKAEREDGWQPIETAPKPDIGANGFGERLLLAVDCGDGTTPSVRRGYWEGTDWYLDCCMGLATASGYRVTHWRPLPAPPTIEQSLAERDEATSLIQSLTARIAELVAERDLLQDILDSRPAINAALPDSYIKWSQAIYSGDAARAALKEAGDERAK